MSADNGPQDRDGEGASGISSRDVLLTVGGVAAAVCAGAAIWGGLEFFASKQRTVGGGLNVTYLQVVMVLGTLACVLGVILCIRTARMRFDDAGALVSETQPEALARFGRLRSVTSARNGDLLVTTSNGTGDFVLRVSPG